MIENSVPEPPLHAFFEPSEFVVALEHTNEVLHVLSRLGVAFEDEQVQRSPELGLALVKLPDVAGAVSAVERALTRTSGSDTTPPADPSTPVTDNADAAELERFMQALRATFRKDYAKWTPTMGKNRLLGHVVGGGKISHGIGGGAALAPRRETDSRLPSRTLETGSGVRVGLLDTSILAHEYCNGGWVSPPGNMLETEAPWKAIAGHATFITGLILVQAPGCVVEHRRVLNDEAGEATAWEVANAIVAMGRSGIDVLNLSLVCYTDDGQPPLAIATAIDRIGPDVVVVAAAGNHGEIPETREGHPQQPAWPAALDDVFAVGSSDDKGERSHFTPRDVPWIDKLVPGERVLSAFLTGKVDVGTVDKPDEQQFDGWARWSGSSFSAAKVSGMIAAEMKPGVTAREALETVSGKP